MSREINQSKIEKDGKIVIVNKIDGAIVPNVTTNTPTSESDSQTASATGSTTPTPVSTPSVAQSATTTNNNGITKTKIKDGLVPNITSQSELPEVTENTSTTSVPSTVTTTPVSITTTNEEIEKKRIQSKFGIYDQNTIKDGIIPIVTANQVNPPNIPPQILPPNVNQFSAFTSALAAVPEPLSIFVPYTGALKDVDLGPQSLSTDVCVTAGCLSDGTVTLTNGVFDVFPQTPTAAPFAQYDIANKKYVDDAVATKDTFLELTDTINTYKNTRILFESGSAVVHSANLTFDGTTLSATALDIDNIGIDGNTISTPSGNLDILMVPHGTGVISVLGTTNYEDNVTHDDDIPNKKYVDDTAAGTTFLSLTDTIGSYTNTRILFESGAAVVDSANLTFDGTTLSATAVSSGVITGTSFVIGANTLTTTEWAFLDGLDQSVSSGASPTFTATNITGVPATSILAGTFGTGAYVFDNTVSGITTLTAEQITSTDDITMQGHLLTMGNAGAATDTVLSFLGSTNSGSITFDESEDVFDYGDAGITTTGLGTFASLRVEGNSDPTQIIINSTDINNVDSEIQLIEGNAGNSLGEASTWGFKWQYESNSNDLLLITGNTTTLNTRLAVSRDSGDFDFQAGDLTTTGNMVLDSDSGTIFFGEDQDASINYDGSNLIINQDAVGNGYVGFSPGATTDTTLRIIGTTDYTDSSILYNFRLDRDINRGVGDNQTAYGIFNQLNLKHTNLQLATSKNNYSILSDFNNTGTMTNPTSGTLVQSFRTFNNIVDDDGTYDSSSTGRNLITEYGGLFQHLVDCTFSDTGGNSPANELQCFGITIDLDINPTLASGALTQTNWGIQIDVLSNGVGTNTNYGIRVDRVSGGDTNYGISLDQDITAFSSTDLGGAIVFGEGQDSTIGYDGTNTIFDNRIGSGDWKFGANLSIADGGDLTTTGAGTFDGGLNASLGAITTDIALFEGIATWNNAGTAFFGIDINITETAQHSTSRIMRLQKDGSPVLELDKDGRMIISDKNGNSLWIKPTTFTADYPLLQMGGDSNHATFSDSGTYYGINSEAGFVGDFVNYLLNGTSIFKVDFSGDTTTTGSITSTDGTAGQSIIASGLIVNNDQNATADDDFQAHTGNIANAFIVDASEDTVNTGTGRIVKTNRITSNTTLTSLYDQVFCNTDGGTFIVTLPAGVNGTRYRIINTGSNNLTITPDGGESLLGSASSSILETNEALTIVYETTEGWF